MKSKINKSLKTVLDSAEIVVNLIDEMKKIIYEEEIKEEQKETVDYIINNMDDVSVSTHQSIYKVKRIIDILENDLLINKEENE